MQEQVTTDGGEELQIKQSEPSGGFQENQLTLFSPQLLSRDQSRSSDRWGCGQLQWWERREPIHTYDIAFSHTNVLHVFKC